MRPGRGGRVIVPGAKRVAADPAAGRAREILIEIDGGIEEVLSVEPAIRALRETGGGRFEVTVCAGDEGLLRNHPGVRQVLNRRGWCGGRRFDAWWRLGGEAGGGRLVDEYARRLGVEVRDRRPRIYLDSFDLLRIRRFGTWRSGGMRVVIGAGTDREERAWDEGKWVELCRYLEGRLGASVIQVGRRGKRFLGVGRDLIGKLTGREVATVLRNSDLLVGVNNSWRHLAGAVGSRAVLLAGSASEASELESEGFCAVRGESAVKDIAIEAVLDGVASAAGCDSLADMEQVMCA